MGFLSNIFKHSTSDTALEIENREQQILIESQILEIDLLKSRISVLEKTNDELQHEINSLLVKKDSHNSSKPPSSDPNKKIKKTRSLRKNSGKKPGGQFGHKGTTLEMTLCPDKTIELIPKYCNVCGKELSQDQAKFHSKRQVVDIPKPKPIWVEYQCHEIKCACGCTQKGHYPEGVDNYIQYGENVQAMIVYQSVYQYIPYKRLHEFFRDWFSIPISQGTITNILKKMSQKGYPIYSRIRNTLAESKSVGSDETGASANGKKSWVWVWQNDGFTFMSFESSRGSDVVKRLFPNGFPDAIIGSDRWGPQLNTTAKGHQLCLAHLLRDLEYLIELEKSIFSYDFKNLLLYAIDLKSINSKFCVDDHIVNKVEASLDELLGAEYSTDDCPKTNTFKKSMNKHRNSILTFLYYEDVEPTNNASERAVRNIKVKQKVSGQFKTGGQDFCVLRSLIDSAKKSEQKVFDIMIWVAQSERCGAV